MTEANSINAATAGILGNTGTSFTGTPMTAHDLIVGGATSSTLTNVAPSATSGVPAISQGASADPAFGTMVVAGGGTGVTSNRAYAVLCGGTTSTNPIQSVVNVGLSGQPLICNGTASLPIFQTPFQTVNNPNKIQQFADDFLQWDLFTDSSSNSEMVTSNSTWFTAGGVLPALVTSLSTNPGIITNSAISLAKGMLIGQRAANASGAWLILGGGTFSINWVFNIGALSGGGNTYNLYCGISNTLGRLIGSDGCYFSYTDTVNSGNWVLNCSAASVVTSVNTSTAATTSGYHNFGLTVNAGATSVSFTIDGSSVGTAITTNIPSAAIYPFILLSRTAGTVAAGTLNADLCYFTQTLTTAR